MPLKVPFNQAHDREKLLGLNYGPEKEILPALSMIVNHDGYIKQEGQELKERLRGFRNPEIDYAAPHLCDELNMRKPKTLDRFQHEIHYYVD